MKTKILFLVIIFSFAGLYAQQKAKLQKADETGFIEVDKAPVLISKLMPEYPKLAKLAGIEGTVYVKILVDENGDIEEARVEKGVKDILDEAALKAAKNAKFSPALLKEKPVKIWVVLPIAFKLSVDKKDASADTKHDSENNVEYEKGPEMIESAKPVYPEEAKAKGLTGKVFVKILVGKDGVPKKADIVKSENDIFNQSAIDAAMKSKFTPAMQGGKPLAVWIVLPYKFALGDKK
ncbi:MAG: energy transducer TonB [Melioribacteraceae bacterium]